MTGGSPIEACDLYRETVNEWTSEPPGTATAALALIEFAGCIAADHLFSEIAGEGGPVSSEVDALHQLEALARAAGWLVKAANTEQLVSIRQSEAAAPSRPALDDPNHPSRKIFA